MATHLDEPVALSLRLLFWELAKGSLVGSTAALAGTAARTYFMWAIAVGKHGTFWLRQAIQIIVATFEFDPTASESCLRALTSEERLAEYGYEEAPTLASELAKLGSYAADFVADAYVSILCHHESSSESTVMLSGVLSLSSNRRQDYDGALHAIEEAYPTFLASTPAQGLRIAMETWRSRTEGRQSHPRDPIELSTAGGTVIRDGSYFIDLDDGHEVPFQILAHLRSWMRSQSPRVAVGVIDELTGQSVHAGVWMALIQAVPRTQDVAHALMPILTNADCLGSGELSFEIGESLVELHASATTADRVAIERTIIGMTNDERQSRVADQLLARFTPEAFATEEARERRLSPEVEQAPSQRPFVRAWDFDPSPDDSDSDLREAGVDTDDPHIRSLLGQARNLERDLPPVLDRETFDSRIQALDRLVADLSQLTTNGADEVRRKAWNSAAAFAAAASRAEWIADTDPDTQRLLVDAVLQSLAIPVSHPREVESFDNSEYWAGGNPRITAVQAVFGLLHYGISTPEVEAQVTLLCSAPEVEVRRQAFQYLPWILADRRPLALSILQARLRVEPSAAVLDAILRVVFRAKRFSDRNGLLQNLRETLVRAQQLGSRGKQLRESCVRKLAILDIWDGDPGARSDIDRLLSAIPARSNLITAVIHILREPLTPAPHTERNVAALTRAVEISTTVVERSSAELARLRARFEGRLATDSARKRYRRLLQHVDAVSNQLYFSCGAYNRKEEEPSPRANPRDVLRLYGSLLEALAGATAPSTTHHTIAVLAYGFESDPRSVLRLVAAAVDAGRVGGYEFDSMGLDLVMSVLRRFVAEQRDLLRTDPIVLAHFLGTLDTFVDVGWGSAHNLSYSLDEVFR
ncbi:hypothetical protein FJ656_20865 [Schumannella luteola]|nr:hypothetical protein FJ656_20865 [Schumannella luteola]